jgi:hypothetical protein
MRHTPRKHRTVYRVSLTALQHYFDAYVFCFQADDEDADAVICQYEAQAAAFLRSLGAMVSVERFTDHMDDELVYVRHVPPGITGVRNERRGQ